MNNLTNWQFQAKAKLQAKGLASNDVNLIFEKVYGENYQTALLLGDLEYCEKLDQILDEVLLLDRPIAHIVGFEYFYGRKYKVTNEVLIPRIETENLIFESVKRIRSQFSPGSKLRVLDLCTGSGIIGITTYHELKDDYVIDLVMSDISKAALAIATENCQLHNVKAELVQSDLFTKITGKFDVILSNPPYVPFEQEMGMMVKEHEPHLALYAKNDGLAIYEQITEIINQYLNSKYFIGFEIGDGQGKVLKEMYKQKCDNIEVVCDLFNRERNVLIWEK